MYPGEEKAQSDEYVLEITIYFSFCPFFPTPTWKEKIYEMKSLVRRSEEEGTAWTAKNLDFSF